MEDKILDLTGMDDASFKIMKDAAKDMIENHTRYVIDKKVKYNKGLDMACDYGMILSGVAMLIGGGIWYFLDKRKLKKL